MRHYSLLLFSGLKFDTGTDNGTSNRDSSAKANNSDKISGLRSGLPVNFIQMFISSCLHNTKQKKQNKKKHICSIKLCGRNRMYNYQTTLLYSQNKTHWTDRMFWFAFCSMICLKVGFSSKIRHISHKFIWYNEIRYFIELKTEGNSLLHCKLHLVKKHWLVIVKVGFPAMHLKSEGNCLLHWKLAFLQCI